MFKILNIFFRYSFFVFLYFLQYFYTLAMSRALCRRLETANSSGGALRTEAGTFVGGMIMIMILINFSLIFNDFDK